MDELIKNNYQLVMSKILKMIYFLIFQCLSLCEWQLNANDAYCDQFSLSDLYVIFVLYEELDCRDVVILAIKWPGCELRRRETFYDEV